MGIPRLDWKRLVNEAALWERNVLRRNSPADVPALLSAYKLYRGHEQELQELLHERNQLAATSAGPSDTGRQLRMDIAKLEEKLQYMGEQVNQLSALLPNDTHPDVPDTDRSIQEFNAESRTDIGQDHVKSMEDAGWIAVEESTRVAGRGFAVLRGVGALLEHVLCEYAMRFAISRGFTPVTVPDLVHEHVVEQAGFEPRSNENDPVFRVGGGLALAGTAELPLLAMHCNTRHALKDLPKLLVACGHAFRREAGQTGANFRGLYRLHQFSKVELFALSDPNSSDQMFEQLCSVQLDLIKSLGFYGRQLEMSAEELGVSAYRKRDLELWLPFSKRFGEVTSASHCTDYQSRRCNIKAGDGRFVHTMNATAVAVPRLIQCIAEHGLRIPAVLVEYIERFQYPV